MFRYRDRDNYYRFSMDRRRNYRRLVKKVAGVVTVLGQDATQYTVGQDYALTIRAVGNILQVYIDGATVLDLLDNDHANGRVGFYCWANSGARFERVVVLDRTRSIGGWTIRDDRNAQLGPSVWRRSNDVMRQTSNIGGITLGAGPQGVLDYPGTYALAGDPSWTDYRLAVDMRADFGNTVGVVFRYVDEENYYRLSVDVFSPHRRLTKRVNGVVTLLWEDPGVVATGQSFRLTVDAVGTRLVGFVGSTQLFDFVDTDLPTGLIGLYCWACRGARFERAEVSRAPLDAHALLRDRFAAGDTNGWVFVDEGTSRGPSVWTVSAAEGSLRQTSEIFSPPSRRDAIEKKGTQAVAGIPAWTDVIVRARLLSLRDAVGLMVRYSDEDNYYRFSMDNLRGYRRFVKNVGGHFTVLWEDDHGYEVGRPIDVTISAIGGTIRGFLDGVLTFVVEDTELAAGRIALYSWRNSSAQFSNVRVYPAGLLFTAWMLDEPFDQPIPRRWTFGVEGAPQSRSSWQVANGELRPLSLWRPLLWRLEHLAYWIFPFFFRPIYAIAGDETWSDYRLSVRVRSDDGTAIGAVFRFLSADYFYSFTMDQRHSWRRLTKRVGGVATVLWEGSIAYTVGREYVLTVDCVGDKITVYVDGVALVSLDDPDLDRGRVGVSCRESSGARFTELRVGTPTWAHYYGFGRERRLPAGTRIRVHGGNGLDNPPAEEPNLQQRFRASVGEPGEIVLSSDGVDLRLVAPDGVVGHTRTFLPERDYSPVGMRVLRRADGTAFLLFPDAGVAFPDGQYRFDISFRRNNQARDSESQAFSEAGGLDDELVRVDVPRATRG